MPIIYPKITQEVHDRIGPAEPAMSNRDTPRSVARRARRLRSLMNGHKVKKTQKTVPASFAKKFYGHKKLGRGGMK